MKIEGDVVTSDEWRWLLDNTEQETLRVPRVNGFDMLAIKECVSAGEPYGGFKMEFDSIDQRDLTVDQMRLQGLLS